MALVGLILGKPADYLVEKQEFLLVKALHMNQNVGQREILKEVEVFLYIVELNTESRQKKIVKWVLSKMTNLDLEAADIDDVGTVGLFLHSFKALFLPAY
ncbi:Two-pore potassium channel [Arachis hypogaea]|nr:Two-pore potassium channel [Arachis hypogaea]